LFDQGVPRARSTRGRLTAASMATAIAAAIALVLPLLGQAPAAATSQGQVEAQINSLGNRISVVDEQYNEATIHLQSVQNEISDSRAESAKAQATRAAVVQIATQQAVAIYKQGAPSVLASFLTSKNLAQFNQRMELLSQVGTWESGIINQLQIADQRAQLAADTLNSQLAQAKAITDQLASERATLISQLATENQLLGQITTATKAAEAQAAAARASAARASLSAELNKSSGRGIGLPALPSSGGAATAIQVAMAQIGKPYVWAGSGPADYDCSGLTMFSWGHAGVSLPHSAAGQYAMLPHVSRSDLQPGDLVFFGSPIHHVGMYVGNGNMVDAPETGEDVQVEPLMSDYVGAARPGV
ncbi:MAG TPA: NlpC/P60 family protein, partial [Actinomycetota bacterium]|nr:NlpC/P60 family protein [Actinomycetota bacterium]